MAIVRRLVQDKLVQANRHSETKATYTIGLSEEGDKYLQIDTYGSAARKLAGKKSQSIRFYPEAVADLRAILKEFP
jgi:hypothetical protein